MSLEASVVFLRKVQDEASPLFTGFIGLIEIILVSLIGLLTPSNVEVAFRIGGLLENIQLKLLLLTQRLALLQAI